MKNLFTLIVLLLSTTLLVAQKTKINEGKFSNLKGITEYNLVFDYTDVQIPKFKSEEDFLQDKMAKRDEKEPGTGEKFKIDWFDDRHEQYEPKFEVSFNKRFEEGEVKVGKKLSSAAYTMKIHTTSLYSGYNIGISRKNANINAVISVYKNDAPDQLLLKVSYTKAEGGGAMGYDYDTGYRISECYAKLAKTFAKTIIKKTK
tara:strand:- start:18303 stop:18908 length:606 start_codon:yes stop_codon:yes gene_type:complete